MADGADFSGILNPKRVVDKRERSAGTDAGDLPGAGSGMLEPHMSQADFSSYKADKPKGPPADLLKKHQSK